MRAARVLAVVVAVLPAAHAAAQPAPGWELRVPERVELVAGAGGTLPIELAIDRGRTISKDAALILDLAPEGGVAVKQRRLRRADAIDPDAAAPRFAVALRADAPGDFTLRVRVQFWLCGTKVCRPVEARRGVVIAVRAEPTPAPTPPP
jgi:hypothetical protein